MLLCEKGRMSERGTRGMSSRLSEHQTLWSGGLWVPSKGGLGVHRDTLRQPWENGGIEHCGYKAEKLEFRLSGFSFIPGEASSPLMVCFNLSILGNSSF